MNFASTRSRDSAVEPVVEQTVQLVGAVLILAAFVAGQAGRLDQRSAGYLLPNLVGSAALALDAIHGRQWGFLLLEGTWAVVSLAGILPALLARTGRPTPPADSPPIGELPT
jgi:hypothetical protein